MAAFDPLKKNAVTLAGNAKARQALIFIHGFGTDQWAWREITPAFEAHFRIVLLDYVGAGRSDPEAFVQHRYLNVQTYAQDVVDIATVLKLREFILVGHSVGGMIALSAALHSPPGLARLILIGTSPRYLDDGDYRGGFSQDEMNELYRCVGNSYDEWADRYAPTAMDNPDWPDLAERFAAGLRAIPQAHALTTLCAIFQSDLRKDLHRLAVPTLIIQSQNDVAVPREAADYLHERIIGSRLAVIGATGHLPHISAPGEVIRVMREFLYRGAVASQSRREDDQHPDIR